jgi:hypothetical protein
MTGSTPIFKKPLHCVVVLPDQKKRISYERGFMGLFKFLSLVVIVEMTQICLHFLYDGHLAPKWSDIPSAAAILFGISPYGQACYSWVKVKLAIDK